MSEILKGRGPDASGIWVSDDKKIGLANRRLSTQDGRPIANQPLWSYDKKVIVVFNGEIYNHRELRKTLEEKGCVFKTNSDTEIIANGYRIWGHDVLRDLKGQFAFTAYDLDSKEVLVARDSMGICPLYYAMFNNQLIVSSTVEAILSLERLPCVLDRQAVTDFFIQDSVGWGKTLFRDISVLRPGHSLLLKVGSEPRLERFYVPGNGYFDGDISRTENDWIKDIREMLYNAVSKCMLGDKEVGVYLSGGIDSISLVAILKKLFPDLIIKTFSAGFADVLTGDAIGEIDFAREMATHFGTVHHEIIVSPDEIMSSIGSFDLPSSSVLNCVIKNLGNKAALEGVNVALSGEGADEMFFGYDHYMAAVAHLNGKFSRLGEKYYLRGEYAKSLDLKALVLEDVFLGGGADIDLDSNPNLAFGSGVEGNRPVRTYIESLRSELLKACPEAEIDKQLIYLDYSLKVPENLLRRAEGPSMAEGVEMRFPFLWDDLIRMLYHMPMAQRIGDGTTKYMLRKVMADLIPDSALNRPKSPFALPAARRMHFKDSGLDFKKPALKHFFNKYFTQFSEAVLDGRYLNEDLFNMAFVEEKIRKQNDSSTCSFDSFLWKLWNFSAWYENRVS